ncbi:MAG: ribosomal protein S18-alanine N-acetyltransferase [Gammaproteobacteria bacterium]|nr:ribosomal protein S18-alanine N-acetyltransferase [Gammaproteobacteria bacterium]
MSAVMSIDEPQLRPMTKEDLFGVMAIEERIYSFPWSEGIFRDCLRVGYFCMVYETAGEIRGYGVMSVAAGECHILNVGIHSVCQRQGLGVRLVGYLLDMARHYHAQMAFLEVRKSNKQARRLYDNVGFNEIGVRPDYYPAEDGKEDALILAKTL